MNAIVRPVLVAALMLSATPAWAVTEYEVGKLVDHVLVDDQLDGYVTVEDPGYSDACFWTRITFDTATQAGRQFLESLLTAKVSANVVNIVYEREGVGCTVTSVTVR